MPNPRDHVSPGPLEIEKLDTLDDLRRACARQRLRDRVRATCPRCRCYVPHDVHCCECGALLPNTPQATGGPLPLPGWMGGD